MINKKNRQFMEKVFFDLLLCIMATMTLTGCQQSDTGRAFAFEFVPITKGGTAEVVAPDRVEYDAAQRTVSANSYQDGINTAVSVATGKTNEEVQEVENDPRLGVYLIKVGSGIGIVSVGQCVYSVAPNPDETRLAQRQSSVIAFEKAKAGLAEHVHGLGMEAKTSILTTMNVVTDSNRSKTDSTSGLTETIDSALDGVIRGFVLYSVNDKPIRDKEQKIVGGVVSVSIVTSPKTRQGVDNFLPDVIEASSFAAGLEQAMSELKSGVIPLHGCKQIILRSSGEIGFVGFGSAVIRTRDDPVKQAEETITASKLAEMRAKSAFVGTVKGERIQHIVRTKEDTFESKKDYDDLVNSAYYASGQQRAEQAMRNFDNTMQVNEEYRSTRSGVIPPGIVMEKWTDADKIWAYCAVGYFPSNTQVSLQQIVNLAPQ